VEDNIKGCSWFSPTFASFLVDAEADLAVAGPSTQTQRMNNNAHHLPLPSSLRYLQNSLPVDKPHCLTRIRIQNTDPDQVLKLASNFEKEHVKISLNCIFTQL
jgi:hypothetical protein